MTTVKTETINGIIGLFVDADQVPDVVMVNGERFVPDSKLKSYVPTKRAQYCQKVDGMGNGCIDSWWVGGNYGASVCRNPNHHKKEE